MKYIRVLYARDLYFINNDNDVFDNDFQMPQLNAPKSFSNIREIIQIVVLFNRDQIVSEQTRPDPIQPDLTRSSYRFVYWKSSISIYEKGFDLKQEEGLFGI